MRYLLLSDLHFRRDAPVCRDQSEWYETFMRKIKWIAELDYECILDAGDVFHRAKPSPQDISMAITAYGLLGTQHVYIAAGNHDLPRHSPDLYEESGLCTLGTARFNMVISPHKRVVRGDLDINLFPYSTEFQQGKGIAVAHIMCWHKVAPFPGLPEHTQAEAVRKRCEDLGYELVVTGHNHRSFHLPGKCQLVNVGGIMRSAADECDRTPTVYIYDSSTREVEKYPIPVIVDAVKTDHLDKIKEKSDLADEMEQGLQTFIQSMDGRAAGVSFRQNMEAALLDSKVEREVRELVEGAMQ